MMGAIRAGARRSCALIHFEDQSAGMGNATISLDIFVG
jgi:hypothetical protein